jgi:hypothetical protein
MRENTQSIKFQSEVYKSQIANANLTQLTRVNRERKKYEAINMNQSFCCC